jgi:uncharacterized protein (TIGR00251 family)
LRNRITEIKTGLVNDTNRLSNHWLAIRVNPNAGRNEITGWRDDVLQVKIAAPPEKGKANKELIDFLSKALGVKKDAISIIKGHTSRNKVIAIKGMSREEIIKRLKI